MPFYDYLCTQCDQPFEVRLSYAEADTTQPACPKCGSPQTRRQIQPVRSRSRVDKSKWLTREQMETAVGLSQTIGGASAMGEGHGHEHEH